MFSALVIAGDFEQYIDWIVKNGLVRDDYKYVCNQWEIFAYHGFPILLIGDYYNNPAYVDLMENLDILQN